jgi:antitoxin ParD1/3/4
MPSFRSNIDAMSVRTSLNVSLTPELGRFVQDRVATGRYQTASEVIREGLRLLEHQERDRQLALEDLKAKLARGSAQADRGEFVDPDRVLKKIESLKRKRKVPG